MLVYEGDPLDVREASMFNYLEIYRKNSSSLCFVSSPLLLTYNALLLSFQCLACVWIVLSETLLHKPLGRCRRARHPFFWKDWRPFTSFFFLSEHTSSCLRTRSRNFLSCFPPNLWSFKSRIFFENILLKMPVLPLMWKHVWKQLRMSVFLYTKCSLCGLF